jgi:hypothetical protein
MNVDIEFHCQNDSQTGTEGVRPKVRSQTFVGYRFCLPGSSAIALCQVYAYVLRLSILMNLYIHPLKGIFHPSYHKIYSFSAFIHPIYHHLSIVGLICHFI